MRRSLNRVAEKLIRRGRTLTPKLVTSYEKYKLCLHMRQRCMPFTQATKKQFRFERYLKRGRSDQNLWISSSRGIRYGLNLSSRLFCNLALLKNPGGRLQRRRCDFYRKNFVRGLTIEVRYRYCTQTCLIKPQRRQHKPMRYLEMRQKCYVRNSPFKLPLRVQNLNRGVSNAHLVSKLGTAR